MKPEINNELDWLAFLYVSGEMSAEESQTFENRMLEDQSVREAVARSVELVAATAAALSSRQRRETVQAQTTTAKSGSVRTARLVYAFMGIAVAASVMLAIAIRSGFSVQDGASGAGNKSVADRSTASLDDLALNWSAARLDSSAGEGMSETADEPADRLEATDTGREEVPSWLLEAVGGKSEPALEREVLR